AVFPHTGRALIIGITGAPGAGKSSLVDKLAALYRKREERVGIIAVDPSSPFSGGAILGDRIRMQTLSLDKGVFIRSMATRGNVGGLARVAIDRIKTRSEEHTSELQSRVDLVCRLLLEKKKRSIIVRSSIHGTVTA